MTADRDTSIRTLRLFLASPGGVEAEWRAVRQVVDEINIPFGRHGWQIEVLGWQCFLELRICQISKSLFSGNVSAKLPFVNSANYDLQETSLADAAIAWLSEKLPSGWQVQAADPSQTPSAYPGPDTRIVLTAPNQIGVAIAVEEKESLTPRGVIDAIAPLIEGARRMGGYLPLLVVSPWLSARTREELGRRGVNYLDLTGNARLLIENPLVLLETDGSDRNPFRKDRPAATLRGAKAGRVVRLLADIRPPYRVAEIAAASGLAPGYVSRLLDSLYESGLIERAHRGEVVDVEITGLLRRWAESYSVFKANDAHRFIAREGVGQLIERLRDTVPGGPPLAVTGSFAAARLALVAAPALFLAYCPDPVALGGELDLLPSDEGANVALLRPYDPVVFVRCEREEELSYVSPSQAAVDCLTGSGRMPAEGEALLDWIEAEEGWRTTSLEDFALPDGRGL
jgi:DNA-binding transcriptional ArsR family regulator